MKREKAPVEESIRIDADKIAVFLGKFQHLFNFYILQHSSKWLEQRFIVIDL